MEFCGEAVAALSAEARMTLCNMTVEAGARAALIAPDAVTDAYVTAHAPQLRGALLDEARVWWATLRSDDGAHFDAEHVFDASRIAPFVTWGTSPDQAIAVDGAVPDPRDEPDTLARLALEKAMDYIGLAAGQPIAGVPIDRVFIGSCTNGRIEDLRVVADLARGRKVAAGVRAMVVPGSGAVRAGPPLAPRRAPAAAARHRPAAGFRAGRGSRA